jgi:hypothetical protein
VVVKTARAVVPQGVAVAAAKARPLFTLSVNREDLLVRNFFMTIYRQSSIQVTWKSTSFKSKLEEP